MAPLSKVVTTKREIDGKAEESSRLLHNLISVNVAERIFCGRFAAKIFAKAGGQKTVSLVADPVRSLRQKHGCLLGYRYVQAEALVSVLSRSEH